jgi:hypothetical protein
MCAGTYLHVIEKYSVGKKTALQRNPGTQLTIIEDDRAFGAEFTAGPNARFLTRNPGARVQDHIICDAVAGYLRRHVHGGRGRNLQATINKFSNGILHAV